MIFMKFIPTWLYIKCHRQTKLKYFGKTIQDPNKYLGSGKYWRSHLKIHGNDIETIWSKLFTDKDELIEFAENFSKENNIVESVNDKGKKIWANEVPENGKQGGQNAGLPSPRKGVSTGHAGFWKGKKRPAHSALLKNRTQSHDHIKNRLESFSQYIKTPTHCANISAAKKGKPNPKLALALKGKPNKNKGKKLKVYPCIHCGIETSGGNLTRWHNDNCKLRGKNYDKAI